MKKFLDVIKKPLVWVGAIIIAILAYFTFKPDGRPVDEPHDEDDLKDIDVDIEKEKEEIDEVDNKINNLEEEIKDLEETPVVVKKVTDVDEARNILLDND